jgi:oxalate decarboxylase/phosphoglucose isomerase-like protein (cupin superfamily)
MTMILPGGGEHIAGMGATLKSAMGPGVAASSFEIVIPPGFDVGAHVHGAGEEVFFVLAGELDMLAFDPADRTVPDWHDWVSASGRRFLRGGPGTFVHVPAGVPHAFANTSSGDVRVFFQSSVPGGHENYFRDLAALLIAAPPEDAVARLRARYGITQLTALRRSGVVRPPAG